MAPLNIDTYTNPNLHLFCSRKYVPIANQLFKEKISVQKNNYLLLLQSDLSSWLFTTKCIRYLIGPSFYYIVYNTKMKASLRLKKKSTCTFSDRSTLFLL